MGNPRRLFPSMEAPYSFQNLPIGCGEALPLAQVFRPRLSHKRLIDMPGVRCVLVDAPANRAVTQANVPQLMRRFGKAGIVPWVNVVIDRNPDRPFAVLALR